MWADLLNSGLRIVEMPPCGHDDPTVQRSPMPTSQSDIQTLIGQFTSELTTLLRRSTLEEVLASLQGGMNGAAPRRGPGRPAVSGAKRGRPFGSKNKPKAGPGGRVRRSSEGLEEMQSALIAHVKANPGQRGDQIAAAVGSDVGTIRLPMKKLIADGKVSTEGQRRGMTYHAGGSGGTGGNGARKAKKVGKKKGRKKAA